MEENENFEDVALPDNIFEQDDSAVTEVTEAQPQAEPPKQETQEAKPSEVDYTKLEIPIKFLKEEKKVPFDEAQRLIQIGMNEERQSAKLQKQLESFNSKGELLKELADLNNISEDELITKLKGEIEQTKIQNIKNGHEIPDEVAKEILESRKFRETIQQKEKEQQDQEAQKKELTDFLEAYPDTKAEEIPKEVWELQRTGVPLKFAYQSHLITKLKTENEILKKNTSNSEKASIPDTTEHGGNTETEDDFMKGFNSVL